LNKKKLGKIEKWKILPKNEFVPLLECHRMKKRIRGTDPSLMYRENVQRNLIYFFITKEKTADKS